MGRGTETRQRRRALVIRLDDAEHAALVAMAERAGLSLGGFARCVLLDAPPPRQSRRPPVERAELARLLAQIGRLGSNVNQIARALNAGGAVEAKEIDQTARAVVEMRDAVMVALGRAA